MSAFLQHYGCEIHNHFVCNGSFLFLFSYLMSKCVTIHSPSFYYWLGFPDCASGKDLPADAGDAGSIRRWERSPGVRNCNPFQYSCLENSTDSGVWRATVRGVTKSQTCAHTHVYDANSIYQLAEYRHQPSRWSVINNCVFWTRTDSGYCPSQWWWWHPFPFVQMCFLGLKR